jgi:SAM-dependent methyltransferase
VFRTIVTMGILPRAADVLSAWAARVRANAEQVERLGEVQNPSDFYAPVAQLFEDDPHRSEEVLDLLRGLVRTDDVVLDIGAGGGRYALPLALVAREVIALDASPGMLGVLRQAMERHGITNVRPVEARWPTEDAPAADVTLISHVGYDIEAIGPFADALEAAARRLCIAVLLEHPPPHEIDRLWPAIHGEERASLPALPEFLTLLLARGRLPEVRLATRPRFAHDSPEIRLMQARRLLWLRPDSEKDHKLRASLEATADQPPARVGVVTWSPR